MTLITSEAGLATHVKDPVSAANEGFQQGFNLFERRRQQQVDNIRTGISLQNHRMNLEKHERVMREDDVKYRTLLRQEQFDKDTYDTKIRTLELNQNTANANLKIAQLKLGESETALERKEGAYQSSIQVSDDLRNQITVGGKYLDHFTETVKGGDLTPESTRQWQSDLTRIGTVMEQMATQIENLQHTNPQAAMELSTELGKLHNQYTASQVAFNNRIGNLSNELNQEIATFDPTDEEAGAQLKELRKKYAHLAPYNMQGWTQTFEGLENRVAVAAKARVDFLNAQNDANSESSKPTVGQEAVDKAFSEEYINYIKNARPQFEKDKTQLQSAIKTLESGDNVSGVFTAMMPENWRPKSKNVRDQVQEVVQRNLKNILGGQFAQQEAAQLLARAYDEAQPEATNADRVKRLLEQLQAIYDNQTAMVEYWEANNGSLVGFTGINPYAGQSLSTLGSGSAAASTPVSDESIDTMFDELD